MDGSFSSDHLSVVLARLSFVVKKKQNDQSWSKFIKINIACWIYPNDWSFSSCSSVWRWRILSWFFFFFWKTFQLNHNDVSVSSSNDMHELIWRTSTFLLLLERRNKETKEILLLLFFFCCDFIRESASPNEGWSILVCEYDRYDSSVLALFCWNYFVNLFIRRSDFQWSRHFRFSQVKILFFFSSTIKNDRFDFYFSLRNDALQRPRNYFLINLAVTDIGLLLTNNSMHVVSSFRKHWVFGQRGIESFSSDYPTKSWPFAFFGFRL